MYNILVCDDEKDIVSALEIYLKTEGYNIFKAYNGKEALEILEKSEIHLVLMDIMMPVCDGVTATARLREKSNVPVIFLSAKGEDTDKILGLNVGADDYVTKPFNPVEVLARVRSQLRRYMQLGGNAVKTALTIGNIELDDAAKEVLVDGEKVMLTPLEFEILKLLMQNAGKVLSPKEIYRLVWKEDCVGSESTTVAVHIRHLREKIEINPAEPRYLKVVWSHGYKMEGGN
ncbi:MAG: response regulator transcription factor [Clostridia bacterium]|nr:response regulator transcription factor [Clostridia bacterium]